MGTLPGLPYIPTWLQGTNTVESKRRIKILARKIAKRRNAATVQYLVQWEELNEDQANRKFADEIECKYPDFKP